MVKTERYIKIAISILILSSTIFSILYYVRGMYMSSCLYAICVLILWLAWRTLKRRTLK